MESNIKIFTKKLYDATQNNIYILENLKEQDLLYNTSQLLINGHTQSQAMLERDIILSIFCKQYKDYVFIGDKLETGKEYKGMFFVMFVTPKGHFTITCPNEHRQYFDGLKYVEKLPSSSVNDFEYNRLVELAKEIYQNK